MLGCEDVRDLLYLFVTNELEDDEFTQVASHLQGCGDCRQAMSEHVKLAGVMPQHISTLGLLYYSRNN